MMWLPHSTTTGVTIPHQLRKVCFLESVMFALMEGPTSARRAKQGHLLWLLAIAVRRKQPLPPLLESFGKSLSGNQAFSIWRFVGFLRRSRFRTHIHTLADRLRDGLSLPDALSDASGLLPRTTLATIRAGHESGCLPESLDRAARQHFQSARQAETCLLYTSPSPRD